MFPPPPPSQAAVCSLDEQRDNHRDFLCFRCPRGSSFRRNDLTTHFRQPQMRCGIHGPDPADPARPVSLFFIQLLFREEEKKPTRLETHRRGPISTGETRRVTSKNDRRTVSVTPPPTTTTIILHSEPADVSVKICFRRLPLTISIHHCVARPDRHFVWNT